MPAVAAELDALRVRIEAMAARIGLRPAHLPTYGMSDQSARPAILYDDSWHYLIAERGEEYSRETRYRADDLLFFVFRDATAMAAGEHEIAHRQPGRDSRRLRFERQVELLMRLDEAWGRRQRGDIERLLARHPYRDATPTASERPARRQRPAILLSALAVGFNAVAASGCAALVVVASSRPGVLLAVAGIVFFGLAAAGFGLMLRASWIASRDARRGR